jgi:hypothetical protein
LIAAKPAQIAVDANQFGTRIPPAQAIQNVYELKLIVEIVLEPQDDLFVRVPTHRLRSMVQHILPNQNFAAQS